METVVLSRNGKEVRLEITLYEGSLLQWYIYIYPISNSPLLSSPLIYPSILGKNRQIRNALEALYLKVNKLKRTQFGPYTLQGVSILIPPLLPFIFYEINLD